MDKLNHRTIVDQIGPKWCQSQRCISDPLLAHFWIRVKSETRFQSGGKSTINQLHRKQASKNQHQSAQPGWNDLSRGSSQRQKQVKDIS